MSKNSISTKQDIKNPCLIILALCIFVFTMNADFSATNIALGHIAKGFSLNLSDSQWINNSYILFMAISYVIGSHLTNHYGLRTTLCAALIFNSIFCLACYLAIGSKSLVLARMGLGVSNGISYSVALLLCTQYLRSSRQGLNISLLFTSMGLGLAAGPIFGGLCVVHSSWRLIYLLSLLLYIIPAGLSLVAIKTNIKQKQLRPDMTSILLMTIGFSLFMYAASEYTQHNFSLENNLTLLLGLGATILALILQNRAPTPVIDMSLFKDKDYNISIFSRLGAQAMFIICLAFFPLYLQNILQLSIIKVSLYMSVLTIAIAISSPIGGWLIDKYGAKSINSCSLILFCGASIGCQFLTTKLSPTLTIFCLAIIGIGISTGFTANTLTCIQSLPLNKKSIGVGVFYALSMLSNIIGIIFFTAIISYSSNYTLPKTLNQSNMHLTTTQLSIIKKASSGVGTINELKYPTNKINNQEFSKLTNIKNQTFIRSMKDGFFILMLLLVVLTLSSFRIESKAKIYTSNTLSAADS